MLYINTIKILWFLIQRSNILGKFLRLKCCILTSDHLHHIWKDFIQSDTIKIKISWNIHTWQTE